ncbi:energy transducer TonB [Leeia sp.]|uniref:energy transducer TonB n=1 Tax=Leeia sp. TaxID=2884678 RepID=UPI0035ADE8B8
MSSRSRLCLALLLALLLHGLLLLWSRPAPVPRLHVELQLRTASAPVTLPVHPDPPSQTPARHTPKVAQQAEHPGGAAAHPSRYSSPPLVQQSKGPVVVAGATVPAPAPQVETAPESRPTGHGAATPLSPAAGPLTEDMPDHPARARCRPVIRYPVVSRELEEQGVVVASVRVDAQGGVQEVRLQQSSGAARLDRTLLDSVPMWQFEPARQQGRAEGGTVLLRFVFQLQEGSGGEGHAGSSVRVCGG